MRHRFFDLAFTPAVQAELARRGCRGGYAAMATGRDDTEDSIAEREIAFIGARDSFYLASVFQTGWPSVQHRGGPVGFLRALGENTIGWAEYRGNPMAILGGRH